MKKERKVIGPNGIIVFDRDVPIEELMESCKNFYGDVIVNGNLYEAGEGDLCTAFLPCSLLVYGNMICHRVLFVAGDYLYCEGKVDLYDIVVAGDVCFNSNSDVSDIDVLGEVELHGDVEMNYGIIRANSIKTSTINIANCDMLKIGC